MELKIDTAKDSKEEIRQAIKLLQTVVGDAPQETSSYSSTYGSLNQSQSPAPSASPGIFNLFSNESQSTLPPTSSQPPDPSTFSMPSPAAQPPAKPRDRRFGDDDDDPKVIIVDY